MTSWYPNKNNQKEAIWIKNHIDGLNSKCRNVIFHFNIYKSDKLEFSNTKEGNLRQTIIGFPTQLWLFIEIIYGLWIFYQFFVKRIHNDYDIINFHIAYPMLTCWHLLEDWVNKPIVITEHWSAYHYNFGVKKELPRVQRIFQQNIPVITVSEALAKDIKTFSRTDFLHFVVPNVVDNKVFYIDKAEERKPFLFMVSQWKDPKTPILVMKTFLEAEISQRFMLKVAGFGPLWSSMQQFVTDRKAEDKIQFLGILDNHQVADKMRKCTAFLHPSDYETFSVVCAEAVACGAFVIAPKVGGIPEVVGDNGLMIKENNCEEWEQAMKKIPASFRSTYDGRFDTATVGAQYTTVLKGVIKSFETRK